jgi:hypothetical protein
MTRISLAAAVQQPVLLIWPHGGQRRARRNALQAANQRTSATADRLAGAAPDRGRIPG